MPLVLFSVLGHDAITVSEGEVWKFVVDFLVMLAIVVLLNKLLVFDVADQTC